MKNHIKTDVIFFYFIQLILINYLVIAVHNNNDNEHTLKELDHGDLPLDDHVARFVKNKLKILVIHLVGEHIKAGGQYYESIDSNDMSKVTECDASIRVIANTLTPYLLWVTNQYMARFYGKNMNFFKFYKKESTAFPNIFSLDYEINHRGSENLSVIMLFMASAFKDKFNSNEKNKISINLLPFLIRQDYGVS